MSEGSPGSKPEAGQSAQEPWVARSNWVSEALGNDWVEVEPGIFRQVAPDDPAPPARPAANAAARSLEQTLREALPADLPKAETASAGSRAEAAPRQSS
jgi:hypothetical protein